MELINYNEKGCNDDCRKCPRNVKLESGREWCDLKMVDLTGIKVIFKKRKKGVLL